MLMSRNCQTCPSMSAPIFFWGVSRFVAFVSALTSHSANQNTQRLFHFTGGIIPCRSLALSHGSYLEHGSLSCTTATCCKNCLGRQLDHQSCYRSNDSTSWSKFVSLGPGTPNARPFATLSFLFLGGMRNATTRVSFVIQLIHHTDMP